MRTNAGLPVQELRSTIMEFHTRNKPATQRLLWVARKEAWRPEQDRRGFLKSGRCSLGSGALPRRVRATCASAESYALSLAHLRALPEADSVGAIFRFFVIVGNRWTRCLNLALESLDCPTPSLLPPPGTTGFIPLLQCVLFSHRLMFLSV